MHVGGLKRRMIYNEIADRSGTKWPILGKHERKSGQFTMDSRATGFFVERGRSGKFAATLIWVAIVGLCVGGQPFLLGFYTDDWPVNAAAARIGAAFSAARLQFAFFVDPTRPGAVPLRYLFSSIAGDHPAVWHGGLVLANIGVALVLIFLIRALSGTSLRDNPAPIWIGLCWLLMPWNVALQFWPTVLPDAVALAVFGVLCVLLVRGWEQNRHHAVLAGGIYLWLCLSYEAFYFQCIALLLVGLTLWRAGRARLTDVAYSAAGLFVAQVGAALWHINSVRLVGTGMIGVERPITREWPRILLGDVLTTIPSMYRSLGAVRIPFAISAILLLMTWCAGYYQALRSAESKPAARNCIALMGCCLVGGGLSLSAYSLGGRGIQATGMATRTLRVVNFWLVVLAGIGVIWLLGRAGRAMRAMTLAALWCLGATLATGHVARMEEWATAWKLQQKLLAEAPIGELRQTPEGATILLINRPTVNGAPIFTAPWDLNAAMPWKYPFLEGRVFRVYDPKGGTLSWDGRQLAYEGDLPAETASELYVWRPAQGSFRKASAPFRVLRNLEVVDGATAQRP